MASLTPPPMAPPNDDSKVADGALKMSRIDPSLIHQVTKLQADNQDLYQQRRELEQKIKEEQDKLKAEQDEKEVLKGKMAKMQEEYASANRKEMTEFRENFMREWMDVLKKLKPETIEKIEGGVENMVKNGMRNDMWELFCCASMAHKNNVNTIEDLQKTNNLLSEKNKELEENLRTVSGFAPTDTRLGKRSRTNDTTNDPPLATSAGGSIGSTAPETDVWGQFEMMMGNKYTGF